MEKVPDTLLRVTPFPHFCLASNSCPMKLTMVMPIVLPICIRLKIPQNWDAFFLPCPLKERTGTCSKETQDTNKITFNDD